MAEKGLEKGSEENQGRLNPPISQHGSSEEQEDQPDIDEAQKPTPLDNQPNPEKEKLKFIKKEIKIPNAEDELEQIAVSTEKNNT